MGKNADKNPSVRATQKSGDGSANRSRGRDSSDSGSPSQSQPGRERNVGAAGEEHSRTEKGQQR